MQRWRPGRVQAIERVASPIDADALVIDHLARLGCDPSQPRECRHYLYLPGEPGARAVARSLTSTGAWDAEVEETCDAWLVTATIHTGLCNESVRARRAQLQSLADDHGGAYDGWEAAAD